MFFVLHWLYFHPDHTMVTGNLEIKEKNKNKNVRQIYEFA